MLVELRESSNPIHGAVEEFITRRHHINAQLRKRINQIHALDGFSGNIIPRRCLGSLSSITTTLENADIEMNEGQTVQYNGSLFVPSQDQEVNTEDVDDNVDKGEQLEDEEVQRDIGGLMQFFDMLVL